jgi:hypothetical protein
LELKKKDPNSKNLTGIKLKVELIVGDQDWSNRKNKKPLKKILTSLNLFRKILIQNNNHNIIH